MNIELPVNHNSLSNSETIKSESEKHRKLQFTRTRNLKPLLVSG
jgi:hypothetical protein